VVNIKKQICYMKKIILLLLVGSVFSSCSLFQKKYGCPTSGAAVGAERLESGDRKAIRAAQKSKFRGGKKFKK